MCNFEKWQVLHMSNSRTFIQSSILWWSWWWINDWYFPDDGDNAGYNSEEEDPFNNYYNFEDEAFDVSLIVFDFLNSLSHGNTIMHHWSQPSLIQVMACCQMAPSHYQIQWWLIKINSLDDTSVRSLIMLFHCCLIMAGTWLYFQLLKKL